MLIWLGSLALLLLLVAVITGPRIWLTRAQDRMANEKLASAPPNTWKLLTRADLVVGRYRRLPGLLALDNEALTFQSLFGDSTTIATSRIVKIITGRRLANGRKLVRHGVLRVVRSGGEETEFVLTGPALSAWRSHLGRWAAQERQADADRVVPGKR
jgi:hypothetical protein